VTSELIGRLTVTGNTSGQRLYHLLEVLGKEKSLVRIEKALGNEGFVNE